MKVRSLSLENYKRFRSKKTFDFTDHETGLIKDLVVLIGENGSGKSSVLQAIAATVGTAAGRIKNPWELHWDGFDPSLINESHRLATNIDLEIEFSEQENRATAEAFDAFTDAKQDSDRSKRPGMNRYVHLKSDGKQVKAKEGAANYQQFQGREFAKQAWRWHPDGFQLFDRIGSIHWYTEQRNALSINADETAPNKNGQQININTLRTRLATLALKSQPRRNGQGTPKQRDFYGYLEEKYKIIFPNRSFIGPVTPSDPSQTLEESWFLLSDGRHDYEISEMSGAEKAVFPILFDFANWNINNSIIIIDEIELHLHPPMQQTLLDALPHLGRNNQFIITTHSDYIHDLVPAANIYRLDGN